MKFFKSLLIAPAALGLMAPVAVNADTAFSPTTKLKSSVNFTVGSNAVETVGKEGKNVGKMRRNARRKRDVRQRYQKALAGLN
jgi:hypothetical protein